MARSIASRVSSDRLSNVLPAQPGPLFGRERDIERACALLDSSRLVTLTGAPGSGKTRLAIAISARLVGRFGEGVRFVDLSSTWDSLLVAPSIGRALGVFETGDHELIEDIKEHVRDLDLLLTLDNFEQLLPAAPLVAELLVSSSRLKILATSRALLNVRWERVYEVQPLAVPDMGEPVAPATLAQSPAVALFLDRARAVRPSFELSRSNAAAVADLCVRLEGLPLAIELAAARTKVFPAYAILDRLEPRLDLLTSTRRDTPARHRTLREAVDWSYQLLSEVERRVFRRLAVFVGNFTLGGAARVCAESNGAEGEILSAISTLVDNSLVRVLAEREDEPRFSMLETIRQFAVEQLEASGEASLIRRRHAELCLEFARQAEPELLGPNQADWFQRLERAHDNLRAALRWSLDAGEAGMALEIGARVWNFWASRGHLSEGERWLAEALSQPDATSSESRARALAAAGNLARAQGDVKRAEALYTESLAAWQATGDELGVAAALNSLGNLASDRREYEEARIHYGNSLKRYRAASDLRGVAASLTNLGMVAGLAGAHADALQFHEQSLKIHRQLDNLRGVQVCLNNIANEAAAVGDFERADACQQERLILVREQGDDWGVAITLNNLGVIARDSGDFERAAALLEDSSRIFSDLQDRWGAGLALYNLGSVCLLQGSLALAVESCSRANEIFYELRAAAHEAECLRLMARVCLAAGHPVTAAQLLGAADVRGSVPDEESQTVRSALNPGAFETARHAGRSVPIEETAAMTKRAVDHPARPIPSRPPAHLFDPLSRRERDVVLLVARGLTNRQIAQQLFISERTVESHVASILNRLGLTSRSQAAVWFVEHSLNTHAPTR